MPIGPILATVIPNRGLSLEAVAGSVRTGDSQVNDRHYG